MAWTEELSDLVSDCVQPGGRVLEIGCGNGVLALALARAGYVVTAIDPRAPDGEIFRQVGLEEFQADGHFDAAVARRSLHHIDDLGGALERIADVLEPGGVLVVGEFAWDRMDEPTARWYSSAGGHDSLDHWREHHSDLHGGEDLIRELDSRFRRRSFEWTPYLARELGRPELEPGEAALIEAGEIRALGFEYVGERV